MPQVLNFSFGPDGGSPNRSLAVGDSRVVNAFVEAAYQGKNGVKYAIYTDPGLDAFVTTIETSVRGHFLINSTLYVCFGETLYKVTSGGATTSIGTIVGSRPIIWAINRNPDAPQVAIVSDSIVYELQADVLQVWQDADLPSGVVSVDFIDGYFFFLLESGVFYISGINDTTIDPFDFADAEARADQGVRAFVYSRRVWIFGTQTIEIWLDSGNATFPFERDTAAVTERGCLAKMSIVALDQNLAFVDDVGRVVKYAGYTPTVISTQTIEQDIRRTITAQQTDQIEGFVYFDAGHEFYVLSGPDWTWVYDATTQLWHQKKSYQSDRWIGRTYIRAFDKHLVGSVDTGVLFEMNFDFLDEDGQYLIVEMVSPILGPWPARMSWYELNLDMEMGVGSNSEPNPQIMLSWSDDGARSYTPDRLETLGGLGEYSKRIRFMGLGTSNREGRCFRVKSSSAVRKVLIEAQAIVEQLAV